jgi:hypothetical protein
MPYGFLGEEQNIFITKSITGNTPTPFFTAANYPTGDPYQSVPHHTVYVNSDVRDAELAPKTLAQSGQTNPRFTTTYHERAVLWQTPVVAYVNADTAIVETIPPITHFNQYRNDIATLVEAQKSDYVRLIIRTPVWYDDTTGVAGTPPPTINGAFTEPDYEGKLTILPVVDRNGVQIPYGSITVTAPKASDIIIPSNVVVNGTVDIVADLAKSVEVNGTISGDVSVDAHEAETVAVNAAVGTQSAPADVTITNVNEAKTVEINGAVSGDLTVTANNAAITVNDAVGGAVIINSTRGASVTLNDKVGGDLTIDADRANITVNEAVDGDVTIDSINGISVVLNNTVDGDVVIDAGRANVEINKAVTGNVRVASDIGDEIWIRTGIEAGMSLTVTAPYATVYLMPGTSDVGVSANRVEIINLDSDTLVIGKGFTVKDLIIDSTLTKAFTIKYAGEISTGLRIGGAGGDITVLIQTDGTAAQNNAAVTKFDALQAKTSGTGSGRLKIATATSLGL